MAQPVAPLRVPVELRLAGGGARWFRQATAVSAEGLLFLRPLPPELAERERPVTVTFHLPEDAEPIVLDARAIEVRGEARRGEDDGPRATAVRFVRPDEAAARRIARYAQARLLGEP